MNKKIIDPYKNIKGYMFLSTRVLINNNKLRVRLQICIPVVERVETLDCG